MAKKARKKTAVKAKKKAKKKPGMVARKKRKATVKSRAKAAARKKPARKAKPKGAIAGIVGGFEAVMDTLTEAEHLHRKMEPRMARDPEE